MGWFEHKPEKPLRQQLEEAREALLEQIAVLEAGPARMEPGEGHFMQAQAAGLRAMLRDIEGELAKAEPDPS
ncbi:MAG TPA: hypothetical protein VIJ94_05305 [Caulobacteraceae bacterium]